MAAGSRTGDRLLDADAQAALSVAYDAEDEADLARRSRLLRHVPRARLTGPWRDVSQMLIRLRTLNADKRLRAMGIRAETRRVTAGGRAATIRLLRPSGPIQGVHLDFHGGGWTLGTAAIDDPLNALIVREHGLAVISVEYRLALGIGLMETIADCVTAGRWLLDQTTGELAHGQVTIGGESAGAHLAVASLLRLRDNARFDRIRGASLFYGCFDLGGTPSAREAGRDTLILHTPSLPDLLPAVTGLSDPERLRSPELSPLYANLTGLPPALLVVGRNDPLLDDTLLLGARWQEQSGNAQLLEVPGAPHAFNRLAGRVADKTNAFARRWLAARHALPLS